ncbi:MAG: ABC transporter substrate-binding protein [Nitrospinota bacterium]
MSKKPCSLAVIFVLSFILSAWSLGFAQEKVIFTLDWVPYGRDVGFFAAEREGYFRGANLSVSFLKGKGSSDSIKRLAVGNAHFGVPDAGTLVVARSKGAKVKLLGIYHDKSMMTVIFLKGSGISRISDLAGKTLGDAPWSAVPVVFPALAHKNGLDPNTVKWIHMNPGAKGASLIAGKVNAITGYITEIPSYEKGAAQAGKELQQLTYAEHGVDLYANGLATTDQRIKTNPDLVRRFTQAIYKGVTWAVENPDKAVDYFVSQHPAVNRAIAARHWDIAVDHLLTPVAREKGIGFINRAKMEYTRAIITQARKLKGQISVDDLYTNEFLPRLFPKKP